MIKRFFRDTVIYSVPNFLSKFLSVLLVPIYTRYLAPEQFGVVDMLTVMGAVVNYIVGLELTQALPRFLVDADGNKKKLITSTAVWFYIVFNGVFICIFVLFRKSLAGLFLENDALDGLLVAAAVSIAFSGLLNIIKSQLRFSLKAKETTIVNTISVLTTPAFTILLLAQLGQAVFSPFIARIAGAALCLLVGFVFIRKDLLFQFDHRLLKKMVVFSLPLVGSSIAVFLASFIDRFALKQLLSFHEVGLYGIAYKFATVINLLTRGIAMSLNPLIYANYKKDSTKKDLSRIFDLFVVVMGVALIEITLFSREFFEVFTTEEYFEAYKVLPIMVFSMIIYSVHIFFPGLILSKETKKIALINVVMAVINIGLNYLLIPIWGIVGAAVATGSGYIIGVFMYGYYNARYYPTGYRWARTAWIAVFCAAVILVNGVFFGNSLVPKLLLGVLSPVGLFLFVYWKALRDKIKGY